MKQYFSSNMTRARSALILHLGPRPVVGGTCLITFSRVTVVHSTAVIWPVAEFVCFGEEPSVVVEFV